MVSVTDARTRRALLKLARRMRRREWIRRGALALQRTLWWSGPVALALGLCHVFAAPVVGSLASLLILAPPVATASWVLMTGRPTLTQALALADRVLATDALFRSAWDVLQTPHGQRGSWADVVLTQARTLSTQCATRLSHAHVIPRQTATSTLLTLLACGIVLLTVGASSNGDAGGPRTILDITADALPESEDGLAKSTSSVLSTISQRRAAAMQTPVDRPRADGATLTEAATSEDTPALLITKDQNQERKATDAEAAAARPFEHAGIALSENTNGPRHGRDAGQQAGRILDVDEELPTHALEVTAVDLALSRRGQNTSTHGPSAEFDEPVAGPSALPNVLAANTGPGDAWVWDAISPAMRTLVANYFQHVQESTDERASQRRQ